MDIFSVLLEPGSLKENEHAFLNEKLKFSSLDLAFLVLNRVSNWIRIRIKL